MSTRFVLSVCLAALAAACGGKSTVLEQEGEVAADAAAPAPSNDAAREAEAAAQSSGMLRVSGSQVVDELGTPVQLRGVAFGNAVWSDIDLPVEDHAEIDFERVAAMGMNLVRFYMNYLTFEDEAAPGTYKQSGFAWIDRNVAWAKAHGIRLLLNMHVPPGGFQSLGEGTALWTDPKNQDRLVALWKAIAARYRDEPTLLGYDLLNEPVTSESKQQWVDLVSSCVRAIREVDPRHIITVERLNGAKASWANDAEMNFFVVPDANVLYEFHFYTPMEFTHQMATWIPGMSQPTTYPDPNAIVADWTDFEWKHWTWDGFPNATMLAVPDGTTPWTQYSVTFTVDDPTFDLAYPVLMSQDNAGTVYFDDITVDEYDAQNALVRQVWKVDVEKADDWSLWLDTATTPPSTGEKVQGMDGHAGALSVGIRGVQGDSSISSNAYFFRVRQGYTYVLTYWARAEGSATGSMSLGRLDFLHAKTGVKVRDEAMLESEIERYAAWGRAHGVPLYLGEFGCMRPAFERGGITWVGDVLDIVSARDIGLTYHAYHESGFGVYGGDYPTPVDPANANQPLIDLFKSRFAK